MAVFGPRWTNDDDESDEFGVDDDDDGTDGTDPGRGWWVDGRRHARRRLDGVLARARRLAPV